VLDQLFQISHGELVIGVKNQLLNAVLFTVGTDWYGPILEYLQKGISIIIYQKKKEVII
jgi:hypothetical protein